MFSKKHPFPGAVGAPGLGAHGTAPLALVCRLPSTPVGCDWSLLLLCDCEGEGEGWTHCLGDGHKVVTSLLLLRV